MPRITAGLLLFLLAACASGGTRRPVRSAELPPGVRVSEICGEGDPIPRLRVLGIDAMGRALPDAVVEISQGSRIVAEGKADQDGSVLFALKATPYILAWELRGFLSPPPFRVRPKSGCEVQVLIEPALPPG